MVQLLGPQDRLLRVVEREHPGVDVLVRGNEITLSGSAAAVAAARSLVDELLAMTKAGHDIGPADVSSSSRILQTRGRAAAVRGAGRGHPLLARQGHPPEDPRSEGLRRRDRGEHDRVRHRPAGTGKTYLAMAKAVQALQRKDVSRIILTRPAVEAGERLGFLPGTLNDKIDPYLRPLYDALNEMMDPEIVPKLMATGTIEVAPLAYMRGRTLNDSFVVLDEAQNTTPEQMKMFLTRLGFGTRMVVTGDITQVDLPQGSSGLRLVTRVLNDIDDIHFARLTSDDVVRHSLVGRIVDAYTEYDEQRTRRPSRARRGTRIRQPRRAPLAPAPVRATISRSEDAHDDRHQQRVGRRRSTRRFCCDSWSTTSPSCTSAPTRTSPSCSSMRAPWRRCTSSGWTSPGRPTC